MLSRSQAAENSSIAYRCDAAAPATACREHPADGSAFALRACAWRKPLCLILDLHGDLGERLGVLPTVVSTEKQLPGTGEHNAYVRLGAAPVAYVSGGQRLTWR
jgi:hypothetical protein